MTAAETSAFIGLILLSLGIASPVGPFVGGLFLAVSLSFLVMAWSEPDDRKDYWLTLATAVAFAVIGAITHSNIPWFNDMPLQGLMAIAGLLSRFLAEGVLTFGRGLTDQMGKVPGALREKFLGKD